MTQHFVFVLTLFCTLFPVIASSALQQLPLMPYPSDISVNDNNKVDLDSFSLRFNGMSKERRVFLKQRLSTQISAFGWKINDEGAAVLPIDFIVNANNATPYKLPSLGHDESYQLTVATSGITIRANSDFGAMQGAATLVQLLFSAKDNKQLSQLTITDSPRFPWRGLMIDSVRHFISIAAIKRQLDGMASAKLNVFHWHLTDDQGWRIELNSYPKLHQVASDGMYYTQAQIKDVVSYAHDLGIRVVPEFDVPGHASAIAVAYPELISEQKNYAMENGWGVFEPLLDPSNPDVYVFVDEIVKEFSTLFPDEYFHIGGDEVHPTQWKDSAKIQAFMVEKKLADTYALQAYFNVEVEKILRKHQKKMMGWDEIYHPDLPNSIMVQSWRGMESLSQIAANNYQGLLSTGFYIDQPQSSAYHYRNELLKKRPDSVVKPAPEDEIVAYQFNMPRLKGSAVKGTLALIKRNNYVLHAYVKLNNNQYQKAAVDKHLSIEPFDVNFSVDSWMGPTRGEFSLTDELPSGRMLIGNTYYPVTIEAIESFDFDRVTLLPNLVSESEANILGGEATLWTEMVTEENIDLRTWPRVFVIAERFWSPKSLNSISAMYQRFALIDDLASALGLQHQQQFTQGLQSLLFPKTDLTPLKILAEQLEPAQYYTRHHIKFQQEKYHQNAPLQRLVDFLPVESQKLIWLKQQLLLFKKGEQQALQNIIDTLRGWHFNFDKVIPLVKKSPKLDNVNKIVESAQKVNILALTVAQNCINNVKIRRNESKRIKNTLHTLHSEVRETVVASNLFAEQLLEVCRQ